MHSGILSGFPLASGYFSPLGLPCKGKVTLSTAWSTFAAYCSLFCLVHTLWFPEQLNPLEFLSHGPHLPLCSHHSLSPFIPARPQHTYPSGPSRSVSMSVSLLRFSLTQRKFLSVNSQWVCLSSVQFISTFISTLSRKYFSHQTVSFFFFIF